MPTFLYKLHHDTPHIIARYDDGYTYKCLLDGRTSFYLSGGFEVPAPGCPCPDRLLLARFYLFIHRNRKWLRIAALAIPAIASLQFILMHMPGNDEMYWSFVSLFSFWLNAALVVTFAACIIAVALWNFGRGIQIKKQTDTPLLDAGQTSIHPDILVSSVSADESADTFADKIETVRDGQIPGQWIVVLPFRHPTGIIVRNAGEDEEFSGFTFTRDNPPYQGDDWPVEQRITLPGRRFEFETWSEYLAYLNTFAAHYPEWAKWAKTKVGDPLTSLANAMRASATVFILVILCSLSASAQKSEQVARYLGARYEQPAPSGEVLFVFQNGAVRRAGDGQKTWKDLLPAHPLYTEATGGRLLRIETSGQIVAPTPEQPEKNVQPVSARPIQEESAGGKSFWEAVPDSGKLEGYKAEMLIAKERFGREMSPRLEFLMWCFINFLLPLLFLVGGVAYYIAKVAAGESAIHLGGFSIFGHDINAIRERATFVVAACIWVTAAVLLVDQLLKAYFFSGSLWWFFVKGVIIIFAAYKISNWLIPNPRVVHDGPRALTPNNYPQLNR